MSMSNARKVRLAVMILVVLAAGIRLATNDGRFFDAPEPPSAPADPSVVEGTPELPPAPAVIQADIVFEPDGRFRVTVGDGVWTVRTGDELGDHVLEIIDEMRRIHGTHGGEEVEGSIRIDAPPGQEIPPDFVPYFIDAFARVGIESIDYELVR